MRPTIAALALACAGAVLPPPAHADVPALVMVHHGRLFDADDHLVDNYPGHGGTR